MTFEKASPATPDNSGLSDGSGGKTGVNTACGGADVGKTSGGTPGPWHVRTLENFGWNIVHYTGGDRFNFKRIAKVPSDEQAADALLIAASPDLLEALRSMTEIAHAYGEYISTVTADELERHPYLPGLEDEINIARAAIAKATGGAS
jgi:hypothetical protein